MSPRGLGRVPQRIQPLLDPQVHVDPWEGLGGPWGGKGRKYSSLTPCASQMERRISTSKTRRPDSFLKDKMRETSLPPLHPPPPPPPPRPPRPPRPLPQVKQ